MGEQPYREYTRTEPDPEFPDLDEPEVQRELADPDHLEGGAPAPEDEVDPESRVADVSDDLVELARYPSTVEADMLLPMLEQVGIDAVVQDIDADQSPGASSSPAAGTPGAENPADTSGFSATIPPEGAVRVLVHDSEFDEARRIVREFEAQREAMREALEPEREPQDIEPGDEEA